MYTDFYEEYYAIWYSNRQEVGMHFSQRLKRLRERRGLSQNALAKTSGVAQAVIQRLEAGVRDVEHLSVGVARRLARALGVSVDYLIGMYEEDEDEDEPAPAVAGLGQW